MDSKVVTICGSMKYAKEMIKIASDLEKSMGGALYNAFMM